MSERCPDFFPEDWVNPIIVTEEDYYVKEYEDGVRVVIYHDDMIDGCLVSPQDYETRYPNRDLHFEQGYENGKLSGRPGFIPEGIPEDTEI